MYIDILIGTGLTISLLIIIFKSCTRDKIVSEIVFTKIFTGFKMKLLVLIPCSLLMIASIIWELFYNTSIKTFSLLRLLPLSFWFYIPYKLVVTNEGIYNVTIFGGSSLICSLEQFRGLSKNEKGYLKLEYISSQNQITYFKINEKFSDKDIEDLNLLADGGIKDLYE